MATDCRPISQPICLRWPSPLRVDRRGAAATLKGGCHVASPLISPNRCLTLAVRSISVGVVRDILQHAASVLIASPRWLAPITREELS